MQRIIPSFRAQTSRRAYTTVLRFNPAAARPNVLANRSSFYLEKRFLTKDVNAFKQNRDVSYDELKPITQQPNDDVLIIDVREPDEVMMGSIPSSVNVPLSNFEKAFDLDDADFMRAYAFRKPNKKQNMIFYCKTGKRSSTAIGLAKGKGFSNVRNYIGSWADWSSKQSKDGQY